MLPLKICFRIDILTSQSKRSIFVNKKKGWIYKIYSFSHKLRQVKVLRPAGTRQLLSAVMISLEPVQWETACVQDIFLYSTSPQALDQLLRMRLRSRLPKLLLSLLFREHWDKSPGWKKNIFRWSSYSVVHRIITKWNNFQLFLPTFSTKMSKNELQPIRTNLSRNIIVRKAPLTFQLSFHFCTENDEKLLKTTLFDC